VLEIDQLPENMLDTFIHEYVHALFDTTGANEERIPKWLEHIYIVALSRDLTNNRKFWSQLLQL